MTDEERRIKALELAVQHCAAINSANTILIGASDVTKTVATRFYTYMKLGT